MRRRATNISGASPHQQVALAGALPKRQAQPDSCSDAAAEPVAGAPPALVLLVAAAGVACAEFACAETVELILLDVTETVELIPLEAAGPSLVAPVVT